MTMGVVAFGAQYKPKAVTFDAAVIAAGIHNASNAAGSVAVDTYPDGDTVVIDLGPNEKLFIPIQSVNTTGTTLGESDLFTLH